MDSKIKTDLYTIDFNAIDFNDVIVPTPLEGGGLYTQMGFFVQTILADRYIHHRELRLVSLESSPSVEYGIKKIFLFSFFTGLSGFEFLRKVNSVVFIHIFRNFCQF